VRVKQLAKRNWYFSRTDGKIRIGCETLLQIYQGPQNISYVFLCTVGYQLQKKALIPKPAPPAPPSLPAGTRLGKPPRKVFHFEYIGVSGVWGAHQRLGCTGRIIVRREVSPGSQASLPVAGDQGCPHPHYLLSSFGGWRSTYRGKGLDTRP
jgi:hypothetical protein